MIFNIKIYHTVISGHRPLQWLENQEDNNGRLGRWAVLLSNLNYKIIYRPGKIHQNADCLSRLRVAAIQDGATFNNIAGIQARDQLCIDIKKYLTAGELNERFVRPPTWAKQIDYFNIKGNILYRIEPSTKYSRRIEPKIQLVTPLSLREKIVKSLHDHPTAAFFRLHSEIKHYMESCPRALLRVTRPVSEESSNPASW